MHSVLCISGVNENPTYSDTSSEKETHLTARGRDLTDKNNAPCELIPLKWQISAELGTP